MAETPSIPPEFLADLTPSDEETLTESELDPPLDGAGGIEPASSREALERAIQWAREGVQLARSGESEKALHALRDARIALLESHLPEPMQELGLGLLDRVLGADLGSVDLEALAEDLQRQLEPVPPEDEERRRVEQESRRILEKFGASSPDPAYLEPFIDHVLVYIEYYRGRHREFFERAFQRKHKYWPTLRSILTARGIPEEQAYMALVESGFNPRARSHANARGLWQFIPGTGKQYGLRQTSDFYDVVRSTEAASEYLLDLIGIFGSRSFLLAMASYNAGEGRIMRCLRRLEDPFADRSYWAIRECLPQETRDYVPRILAAAIIGSNPKQYGFDLATEEEVARDYDVVTIPTPTSLASLASRAGVTVAALREANTDLSTQARTTPVRNFPLYVPKGGGGELIADLATSQQTEGTTELPLSVQIGAEVPRSRPSSAVPKVEIEGSPQRRSEPGATRQKTEVVARAGDTLGEIAERHGVSVAELKSWNPFLRNRVLYRGDRLVLYETRVSSPQTYRVRRGDNLASIAQRHGVSVKDLVTWNGLRSANRIYPGQNLEIRSSTGSPWVTYTVRRGNSLQTIGQLFEVRYRDIMAWNNLKSSRLRAGQKLKIHPARPIERIEHRVKRGESVGRIARKYGVSVSSILTANGLGRRSVLRVGVKLVVYQSRR